MAVAGTVEVIPLASINSCNVLTDSGSIGGDAFNRPGLSFPAAYSLLFTVPIGMCNIAAVFSEVPPPYNTEGL